MQCILITILLVVVSLNISTTTAQCIKQDVIVGTGYNLIYGNPQSEQDPGLRRTNQILRTTYNSSKETTIRGRTICIPDQATIVPVTFCSYEEETKFFAGTSSYRNELELNVKVSGGADYGLASFSFSMSNDFKKVEKSTKSKREVYFDKVAYCYISNQRYRVANIPYKSNYGVSEEFYNAFHSLPTTKPKVTGEGEGSVYYEFLRNWGTHIVSKATMGGRHLERSVSSLRKLYEFAEITDKASISTSGSYEGYSASLDVDLNTLNRKTNSSTSFGEKKISRTVGSTIKKSDDGWHIPDGDTSVPEPAKIELISIGMVCKYDGYWSVLNLNLSISAEPLKTLCSNLKYALKTYAKYLRLKKLADNVKIPLIWPDGTYGFPKAKSGCPDQKGVEFKSGFRFHDTEDDDPNNYWSNKLHLAGKFHKNDLQHEFCMKNVYYVDEKYHYLKFGKGNYCFYKQGKCPHGFQESWLKWDDEDDHNKNKMGGTLPDGNYGRDTIIYYCCRKDAYSYTIPIILPHHKPFYLLRVGGYCQKVLNMDETQEFVRWDDEDDDNKSSRHGDLHPDDDGGSDNHKLYFCYYTPQKPKKPRKPKKK